MHCVRERAHPSHTTCVDGRVQSMKVISLLPLCRIQGLSSGHQAWQQNFYLTSHLVSPITLIVFFVYLVYFAPLVIVPEILRMLCPVLCH